MPAAPERGGAHRIVTAARSGRLRREACRRRQCLAGEALLPRRGASDLDGARQGVVQAEVLLRPAGCAYARSVRPGRAGPAAARHGPRRSDAAAEDRHLEQKLPVGGAAALRVGSLVVERPAVLRRWPAGCEGRL